MAVNFQKMNNEMTAMVEFRTMSYADLKQVISVEEKAYPHPWTLGIFRDCLRVGYNAWVMTLDNDVIGYGIVMLSPGEAHILNICISPDYQLEVRRSNEHAQELYKSEGFHELGVRKAYYPADNGREDAIILAKYISPDDSR